METIQILIAIGTLIAVTLSIISFFSSRKKDQGELDKQQDIDIKVLQEKQNALSERVSKMEGAVQVTDSKLSKEVEKLYNRIDQFATEFREELRGLTSAILSQKK